MSNQEIANRLYELCEQGKGDDAYEELFSENATSTEPSMANRGQMETVTGLAAVKEKSARFQTMLEEMYGGYTNKPVVFGNHIFMEMGMDAKIKGMDRMEMREMAYYVVEDGKIISQQFFY